jgi:spore maturation protein CgeB
VQILYAALKYDYGRREQGCSFEHFNFYDSLVRMGHDVLYFDIGTIEQERGRPALNKLLLDTVKAEHPDVLFTVLFRDELEEGAVREISENTDTTTIAWFSDDHWRFDTYSRQRAPWFNWAVTTSSEAFYKYQLLGQSNVLKSQWACNPFLYRRIDVPKLLPVSFVGLPHGNRRLVMQAIRDAGIDVRVFGKGWGSGRVSQDDMIRIFNESQINLNLANSSAARSTRRRALNVLLHMTATSPLPELIRRLCVRAAAVADRRLPVESSTFPEQIKGRNFEVPGCGGFLLTAVADDLERYYTPGEEVACFRTTSELVDQVKRFLRLSDEREMIALAGYERTLREHTYAHRFDAIFRAAGLSSVSVCDVLTGRVRPGSTRELAPA